MDVMQIANGIPMWIACGIPVVLVVIQAVLFARGAYGAGKKMGLGEDKMKKAAKMLEYEIAAELRDEIIRLRGEK